MDMFRLGLVVNPLAGLGGPVALKGSDGVAAEALARGAEPRALERTRVALECLLPLVEKIEFLTFPGAMGGELLERMGFRHRLLGEWQEWSAARRIPGWRSSACRRPVSP